MRNHRCFFGTYRVFRPNRHCGTLNTEYPSDIMYLAGVLPRWPVRNTRRELAGRATQRA